MARTWRGCGRCRSRSTWRRVEGDAYPYRLAEAIVLSLRGVEDADRSGRCAAVMGLLSVLAETGVSRRLLHAASDGPGTAGDGAAGIDAVAEPAGGRIAGGVQPG